MDAETERVIGRLREIYRKGRRFQVTAGTVVITITATERVKLAFEASEPVKVVMLDCTKAKATIDVASS